MKSLVLLCLMASSAWMAAQTNMLFTNPGMDVILAGDGDPQAWPPTLEYISPEDLVAQLKDRISEDSLKSYLIEMRRFETRNTGSDTVSDTRGIGAARRWIHDRFASFSERVEGRLLTGYFQFDQEICDMGRHRNVVALLPGSDPDAGTIIVEGHMDSRCSTACDTECLAQGMEDNGSGTALVMELARAMSPFEFKTSILFVATTGEEQGLFGANALAEYFVQQDYALKLVQNNDIVGGIICGETSSPPSCPGLNDIDSTQVRIFSRGSFNAPGKGLARYIKLQYEEMLKPLVTVPMLITIMSAEDRAGRGGDHIPFRERGFAAVRFTSANEHGDASNDADYHDRQHTSEDILGVDTDSDGEIDSFFVNFNYLARNARINATSAAMAAIGPVDRPVITEHWFDGDFFSFAIESDTDYPEYVVGVRTDFNDFDTLHYFTEKNAPVYQLPERKFSVFLSVAAIDSNGIESQFSEEVLSVLSSTEEPDVANEKPIRLMSNRPNPFDESTMLSFYADKPVEYRDAYIAITDASGRQIARLPTEVQQGVNEVLFEHGYGTSGILVQTLVIDGRIIDSGTMVFAN